MAYSAIRAIAAVALIVGAALGRSPTASAQSFDAGASDTVTIQPSSPPSFTVVPPQLPLNVSTGSADWNWNYYFGWHIDPAEKLPAGSNPVLGIADDDTSSWVSFQNGDSDWSSSTTLTFFTTLLLPAKDLRTFRLSGSWAAWGYSAVLELNGVVLGTWDESQAPPSELLSFSAPPSLLQVENTLSVTLSLDPKDAVFVSSSLSDLT
jgi:hypothetical protein